MLNGEKKLLELANNEAMSDAFYVTPLEGQLIDENHEQFSKCLEAFKVLTNNFASQTQLVAFWVAYMNFIGKFPWVDRHPKLVDIMFEEDNMDVSDKVLRALPTWWINGFPKTYNKLCGEIYKLVEYEEFDTGAIAQEKFKKFRAKIPSPMDKKIFSKARLGFILETLNKHGVIDNNFMSNYKNRTKNSNKNARIKISGHPVDLLRLSSSKTWSSCMKPGGEYSHCITSLFTDPLIAIMYHDDKSMAKRSLAAPRSRMILHLMANYEIKNDSKISDYSSFFKAVCRYVHQGDKAVLKYTVKAKDWYVAMDRLYDCGSQEMLIPFIHIILNKAKEAGIKVAAPRNYNIVQNHLSCSNPFKNKSNGVFLSSPIFHSLGFKTYNDNLVGDYDKNHFGNIAMSPWGPAPTRSDGGIVRASFLEAVEIDRL
jgi:hypothetical protein